MAKDGIRKRQKRRRYSKEFKVEAVQMLLDGHSAASVAENLGIPRTNTLFSAIQVIHDEEHLVVKTPSASWTICVDQVVRTVAE